METKTLPGTVGEAKQDEQRDEHSSSVSDKLFKNFDSRIDELYWRESTGDSNTLLVAEEERNPETIFELSLVGEGLSSTEVEPSSVDWNVRGDPVNTLSKPESPSQQWD